MEMETGIWRRGGWGGKGKGAAGSCVNVFCTMEMKLKKIVEALAEHDFSF